jgi:hypothetical protein
MTWARQWDIVIKGKKKKKGRHRAEHSRAESSSTVELEDK